ncbi:MAG: Glycine oxidase ThiO [uncultured Solirubrobacteraceae bacterium]|uniref:glycine oxidase n=1 Tax=uncultured Solirubrobacteraceae bacterium TaxID=1162706 RepID=A0A6J4RA96_9ACTN|nr:MAG: Glycine oxidase ThiO [uncultured Solirubrobacteraceae bacterium]
MVSLQVQPDAVVLGGGPIGLATAWRAAERGLRVQVLDAGLPGAWSAAAGMLAPATEAEYGERALLELGLRSAAAYEGFAAELADASGRDPGFRRAGTLVVARDRDDAEEFDRLHAFRRSLGLEVERLRPTQARRVEPALAPTVRLALDFPHDHSIDPRRMVAALRQAVLNAGGVIRHGARVTAIEVGSDRVTGVRLEDGEFVGAGAVLIAGGAWAAQLEGLPEHARVPVRPVKGTVLRLRDPAGPGLIERAIRTREAYLVPRADGGYVLGATMEDQGFDLTPTAGGVFELLRDISEVLPGVHELMLEEVLCGLRPTTPDNLPAIGAGALEGLTWATGHFRNGILLTPASAELAAAALAGEALPDWAADCSPQRFAAGVPA